MADEQLAFGWGQEPEKPASARLRDAGITVEGGGGAEAVREQLAPYIHHRTTGRPWVVVKSAMSLDGRTAAPDGSSQWITSAPARSDAHRIRAESDAIVVGAATVRSDNPALTVRDWAPASDHRVVDPLRVVLGDDFPDDAKVHPCLTWTGSLPPRHEPTHAATALRRVCVCSPGRSRRWVRGVSTWCSPTSCVVSSNRSYRCSANGSRPADR